MVQPKLIDESHLWDCYNGLLLSSDVERIRKLLVRYNLFKNSLDVPGDIVECGVFKGAGLMYWLKLLHIFATASQKRVVGFDTFGPFDRSLLSPYEEATAQEYESEAGLQGITKQEVWAQIVQAGFAQKAELVAGDLQRTAAEYVAKNPGFRISLLDLDVDTYVATSAALQAFWPVLSRGGMVILDEYACRGWGESDAVDEFFAQKKVKIYSVSYSSKPTAYVIKP